MERLVNMCLLLVFFWMWFSVQGRITVNIKPNKTIFYVDLRKMPKEKIVCESNCRINWKCKYSWLLYDNNYFKEFSKGKILLLNKTLKGNNTFKCDVLIPHDDRFQGQSNAITIIFKENRSSTSATHSVSLIQSSTNTMYSHSIPITAAKPKMSPPKFSSGNRSNTPTTHSVTVIQSSTKTVFSQSTTEVENNGSFLIIGFCGGGVLLLITFLILVIVLCVMSKQKLNKTIKKSRNDTSQEKDPGVDMTENTLYISADIVTEMPQSNPNQNNTSTKENGNDVYAVVNKTRKNENHIPMYAEIRKSQSGKEKTEMNKKQSVKEKNQSGQNVNNSGMVYLEIDFDNMSSNRKTAMQGAEDSTQYADINSIEHADPLLKSVE